MKNIPVIILTGFLGAGKTTFLRKIIQNEAYGDSAILINEFGEVGIDQHLIAPITEQIVLLSSGCVCCQIRGELKTAITTLLTQRNQGNIPKFKRLIIETTGLAEPTPIVATLQNDPVLRHQMFIQKIVTIVDATNAFSTADTQPIWWRQVSAADQILITKHDIAPQQAQKLQNYLSVKLGNIVCLMDNQKILTQSTNASKKISKLPDMPIHNHIQTTILSVPSPIDWQLFAIWLSALLYCHGKNILRIKGIIDIGDELPILLNGVQHMIYPPEHIVIPQNEITNQLVIISENINPKDIQVSFSKHCLSSSNKHSNY